MSAAAAIAAAPDQRRPSDAQPPDLSEIWGDRAPQGNGGSGAPTKPPEEAGAAASPSAAKQPEPFAALAATDGALRWVVAAVMIQLMAASFAFLAPLVYGTPITKANMDSRMWFHGWR